MTNSLGSSSWTDATGTNAWSFVVSNLAFGRNTHPDPFARQLGATTPPTNSISYLRLAPVIG
jgi:hypothetical protein